MTRRRTKRMFNEEILSMKNSLYVFRYVCIATFNLTSAHCESRRDKLSLRGTNFNFLSRFENADNY